MSESVSPQNQFKFGLLVLGVGVVFAIIVTFVALAKSPWFFVGYALIIPNIYTGVRSILASRRAS